MSQMMGNLPAARVNPAHPFLHVGIDYAGPIKIRLSAGRGLNLIKGYIAVFVCFVMKTIHLEALSSYDTVHFMNAFKRFISWRG